jgi:sulfur carrier protein
VNVFVNGQAREMPAGTTVAGLLELLSVPRDRTAVEVNREIVPRSLHAGRTLREGDRVEIVTMVGGG